MAINGMMEDEAGEAQEIPQPTGVPELPEVGETDETNDITNLNRGGTATLAKSTKKVDSDYKAISVDSKDRDKVLEKILADYRWAANYRSSFKKDWDRFYRLYKSRVARPGDAYPFESNVFIPYVFSIIETQLPMIMQQIFSTGQFVDVHGRRVDDQINAPIVHDILSYQFERNIGVHNLVYEWAKQALIYGTSPALIDWEYKTMPVKVRVPKYNVDGSIIGEKSVELNRTISNNPISKVIDIQRYFQCPITPESPCTSNDVLFAGWEFSATYDELFEDALSGKYEMEEVKKVDMNGPTNSAGFQYQDDRANIIGKAGPWNSMIDPTARSLIPCIKYFGKFNLDGKYRYMVATVAFPGGLPGYGANTSGPGAGVGVLIEFKDVPYYFSRIPVSLCRVNLNKGELYGMGDIEVIESLQMELTDQRNQRNDIIVRAMNPMFKRLRGANIDESQLIYRPMGMVDVDSHDDLQPLITDQSTLQNAFTEERTIKQDIQFASGVSDFIVGQFQNSSGFNDTATGISLIQAAAQGRIILKAQFLQVAIKDMAETVWALDQQYLPYDTVVKVLDPLSASRYKFIRATPDVINGQYDFTVVSAPAAGNPQVRQQQFIQVMQVSAQIIQAAQQQGLQINVNYSNLLKRVFQEFHIPNIGEILPDVGTLGLMNQIPDQVNNKMATGQELDPEAENALMSQGQQVPVQFGDDDVSHILSHQAAAMSGDDNSRQLFNQHIVQHSQQLQRKRQVLQQTTLSLDQQIAAENGNPAGNPAAQLAQRGLSQGQQPLPQPMPQGGPAGAPPGANGGGVSSPNNAGGMESLIRGAGNMAAGNG